MLRGFGLWYCESWGIGENEKMKPDSTTQRGAFCRCCWNRRDVILFSVVRKLTASRENRGVLLGDEVMKTASHRNCTLQATSKEFEQLLQGRKWEFEFLHCKATLLISVTIINQSVLCSTIKTSVKYEDSQQYSDSQ